MNTAWIGIVGAIVGSLLTLAGTWSTNRHQDKQAERNNTRARREEWFRRVQWVETLTASSAEGRREHGFEILAALSAATGLESEDQRLLQALTTPELQDIVGLVDVPAFVRDNDSTDQHEGGSR